MSQVFDIAEVVAALEPPIFVDRKGRRHVGRFLSIEEWYTFAARHGSLVVQGMTGAEWRGHLRYFVDRVFPPCRIRQWLNALAHRRGVRWLAPLLEAHWPTVADLVLTLPYRRQLEALQDFISSLASEQWPMQETPEPGPASETTATATSSNPEDTSPSPT